MTDTVTSRELATASVGDGSRYRPNSKYARLYAQGDFRFPFVVDPTTDTFQGYAVTGNGYGLKVRFALNREFNGLCVIKDYEISIPGAGYEKGDFVKFYLGPSAYGVYIICKVKAVSQDQKLKIASVATNATVDVDTVATDATVNIDTVATDATIDIATVAKDATFNVDVVTTNATIDIDTVATNATIDIDTVKSDATIDIDTVATDATFNVDAVTADATIQIDAVTADANLQVTEAKHMKIGDTITGKNFRNYRCYYCCRN